MKSKQLANVLIKIIGLYICLCAIPGLVSGTAVVIGRALGTPQGNEAFAFVLPEAIGAVIQFVVGVILVAKSRKLAAFWFKNDED
jgi:hypothetical protein